MNEHAKLSKDLSDELDRTLGALASPPKETPHDGAVAMRTVPAGSTDQAQKAFAERLKRDRLADTHATEHTPKAAVERERQRLDSEKHDSWQQALGQERKQPDAFDHYRDEAGNPRFDGYDKPSLSQPTSGPMLPPSYQGAVSNAVTPPSKLEQAYQLLDIQARSLAEMRRSMEGLDATNRKAVELIKAIREVL